MDNCIDLTNKKETSLINVFDFNNIMNITKENVDYKRIYDLTKVDCDKLGIKLNGVRLTDERHIKEIAEPIINSQPFISCIEVDINTMGVADGQHRFEAYKKAWEHGYKGTMEVRFLDIPSHCYNDVVRDKNIHSKNWTIKDYKRAAMLNGNPAMLKINEFCMSHDLLHGKIKKDGTAPIKDRYAMAFLKGANVTNEIKNGTLKISNDDIEYAEDIYKEVVILLNELQFKSTAAWFESFVQAWYDIRRDARLMKRFENVGMEYFYNEVHCMERATTSSKYEWKERFIGILQMVEEKKLKKLI